MYFLGLLIIVAVCCWAREVYFATISIFCKSQVFFNLCVLIGEIIFFSSAGPPVGLRWKSPPWGLLAKQLISEAEARQSLAHFLLCYSIHREQHSDNPSGHNWCITHSQLELKIVLERVQPFGLVDSPPLDSRVPVDSRVQPYMECCRLL